MNWNHTKETQSPKKRTCKKAQGACAFDICLSSILPAYWLAMGRKGRKISFNILFIEYLVSLTSAFTKFSVFLQLLHILAISSLCLISWFSSFIFPVENLGSSHFSSLSSSLAFAFIMVFHLYHFFTLPFLVSHHFITYFFICMYRLFIFPSVLPFCLSGAWILTGVTLFKEENEWLLVFSSADGHTLHSGDQL